ncbi:hypothetical protein A3752_14105 [Oleiphilus sp. HI0081]|jgi:hypothetical protein|uniref:hypothetical protein n=2 Tax=Oleiphilus TaxID=141450 RepID=UPI0007C33833|nr:MULTISPECIES: hypothetical protein [unclassified Oleiphilus]KZY42229.1 hypothetical protein A3732_02595 [Oleiphilus sp. HI0050]KZY92396.1 hypothetical protein A3743_06565 [Oleiphilus sp. HI0072]KZZ10619.1 hypothetical protein A3749_10725 [Oleiphilus sp. HI0078]KZZ19568.1 hypothetical protein A3752_14105 [Oleiphilus sp. HI0081]KZY28406.1 hypothetical protein A3729_13455 [Oleiphilus sp. HI0043]
MRLSLLFLICLVLTACSTRDLQGTLGGSTAQRLVTHSIDDLVRSIEDEKLDALEGKNVYINSYFLSDSPLKAYADKRLAIELESRFGINVVATQEESEQVMTAFYTSLGTDLDNFGIAIPFGYVPGVAENTQLNIITLEKFHGIAEMYYYIGETGSENRSQVLQAKVKTDALGLPFITIPLSNIDRHESLF